MVVHRSAEAMAQFQQWLDRLARPIEFASRDAFARLPTVKNLSTYVSSQILHALSHQVYPKSIEAALLKLRALFEEDQQRFTLEEQQRRLREAAAILRTLREATEDQGRVWEEPEALTVPQPVPPQSTRDLWTVPIRFAKGVGPQRASTLQRLGIETVEDALWTVPWRYEDRSVMTPIGQLVPGMVTAVCGTVVKNSAKRTRNRRFTV
jgi:ATP-dependent DNA helicase RecG